MKQIILILTIAFSFCAGAQTKKVLPIIDMHLHALPANWDGPPPVSMCSPFEHWNVHDPKEDAMQYYINSVSKGLYCNGVSFRSPMTDDSIMNETLKIMDKYNIYGVTSGPLVQKWKQKSPGRIITGLIFSPDMNIPIEQIRKWVTTDSIKVLGEIVAQYSGITLSDSIMEPYLDLAEELDIPISVHVGPGPPGIAYTGAKNYRARFHSALVIEEALIKHPKLRVIVAHAGWPMIDDMIAVMYAHPQVYVDLGIICYGFPKKEFYNYLQRMIDAGFQKRICFGSDQMIWPQTIAAGIQTINNATFLTQEQKRDILYNNAARFLRLSNEEIKKQNDQSF
ncbi:amidohydrolase family protein [Polluticaenibacter yanchengensis]|uniref:Amidohydrolase family protein n=1 Tax=Polluticaenibacter yanchengensis TaxID=3014562 RepID=A0ABT4UHH8_9BACT|nr:amidohydrolase family protein [Chitinophagaceae bacterium LY-5]